jgi:hypothetical protein
MLVSTNILFINYKYYVLSIHTYQSKVNNESAVEVNEFTLCQEDTLHLYSI